MWPFRRRQKISSNELANYIAIFNVLTDLDKPSLFLFKNKTSLKEMEYLLEENILIMVMMFFAIMKYFNYNKEKYNNLLTNYISCCQDRMLATYIIDKSIDIRTIFIKRFDEYRKALDADIKEDGFYVTGRKMCECLGVSDNDLANYMPAMHVFTNNMKAEDKYFCEIMEMFEIDESSKCKFDVELLILCAQEARK